MTGDYRMAIYIILYMTRMLENYKDDTRKPLMGTVCFSTSWTVCSLSGSSVHGILQPRILECVAVSFCSGSSRPRDQTGVSCIVGRFFTIWVTREALVLPYDRATAVFSIYLSELKTYLHTKMFILALLVIAKTCKQPKCSVGECINKRWYIHTTSMNIIQG